MELEGKKLLLKDLCARLPYGIKCRFISSKGDIPSTIVKIDVENEAVSHKPEGQSLIYFHFVESGNIKPYLRPISSMSDKEIDKLFDILHIDKDGNDEDWIKINDVVGIKFFFSSGKWIENVAEAYDYLNSIHIDYRGLVPMGLALEAPEGMY